MPISKETQNLIDLARKSTVPVTVLPPERIPVTLPGHRWMAKGGQEAKRVPIPKSQKQFWWTNLANRVVNDASHY